MSQRSSVDIIESGDDGKANVCPICSRDFNTVAGLKQHWTKGHSADEINAAIAAKTQYINQSPATNSCDTLTASSKNSWNKFQIVCDGGDKSSGQCYHQFDIRENESTGDCMFSAVLEFLRRQSRPDAPNNVHELRCMAVDYVLTADTPGGESFFDRIKHDLIINLAQEIPSLSSCNASDEVRKGDYATYMSAPGKYGTTVELCAMAELFNFGFYIVRKIDETTYSCYDYGSTERIPNHHPNSVAYFLFSGSVGGGHFRLLLPNEESVDVVIPFGDYTIFEDHTTSRQTTIVPAHFSGFTASPNETTETNNPSPDTSFDDFVILLARCKSNIWVLKRVPRGARIMAANKLSNCLEECLANPKLATNWKNLLTFAYTSLRVPEKVKNVSLATLVKRNIEKSELIFTKRVKKKIPISLSKRIECKIAEGNVKGAVKLLSSSDTLAPQNLSTLEQLKLKHPPPSREMKFPDPPGKDTVPLVVSERDTFHSIRSFPNGSGSGVDGLLPQHLKDLTLPSTGEAGLRLMRAVTALSNLLLSGNSPHRSW